MSTLPPGQMIPEPTALVVQQPMSHSVAEIKRQVVQIQELMNEILINKTHYGLVPGCGDKPVLLKPGAEKLCFMFKFAPTMDTTMVELDEPGHREYRTACTLTHIPTGSFVCRVTASSSTLESRHRYRWQGRGESRKRIENSDIADQYNTCLKMSEKRALVAAALVATAAGDIFAQDLEDSPLPPQEPPKRRQGNGGKAKSRRSAPAGDDLSEYGDIPGDVPDQLTLEEILARLENAKTKRELDALKLQIKGLQGSDFDTGKAAFEEQVKVLQEKGNAD